MTEFIKIVNKDGCGGISAAIIRTENLRKIIRWYGDSGTAIGFKWYDTSTSKERRWIYDCGNKYLCDLMFEQYEKLLTGTIIQVKQLDFERETE